MEKNPTKFYNLVQHTKSMLSKNNVSKCDVFTLLTLHTEEDEDHVGCILMLPLLQQKDAHFNKH